MGNAGFYVLFFQMTPVSMCYFSASASRFFYSFFFRSKSIINQTQVCFRCSRNLLFPLHHHFLCRHCFPTFFSFWGDVFIPVIAEWMCKQVWGTIKVSADMETVTRQGKTITNAELWKVIGRTICQPDQCQAKESILLPLFEPVGNSSFIKGTMSVASRPCLFILEGCWLVCLYHDLKTIQIRAFRDT